MMTTSWPVTTTGVTRLPSERVQISRQNPNPFNCRCHDQTPSTSCCCCCCVCVERTDQVNLHLLVVQSSYLVEVNNEHVILGNSALLKCTIPSFVADFIRVASWTVVSDHSGELVLDLDSTGRCLFDFQPDTPGSPIRFIFIETAEIIARAEISRKFKRNFLIGSFGHVIRRANHVTRPGITFKLLKIRNMRAE
jgi:hypothetical protein